MLSVGYPMKKVCTVLAPGCHATSCVLHPYYAKLIVLCLQVSTSCITCRSDMSVSAGAHAVSTSREHTLTCCAADSQTLTGKDAFEPWFRKYLETFRLGNVSSEQFKELFLSDFSHLPAAKEIDWDTWFFGKGMTQQGYCYLNAGRTRPCTR